MGQINTNNYPTVNSLADADLLIVENATNGTGTTTPKQLRENAIGTDTLQTSSQTVTGAINELKGEIDAGAGVVCYDVDTITSGYLGGQFSGSANLLLLHLTTDGTADATNGYMMMLSYSRPVARFAYGRLVDTDGVAYKQDVYADNTIICKISDSGTGTESDPEQVVILGIINAGFMLTPTAVVSDRDRQDGQGNTLSVLAEALTKTANGNPVVISDCAGGKARSLITSINAIQDLHGLPFPYVGGAFKNKLDSSAVTQGSFDDPSATANCVSDYTPISGGADYYMSGNSGYADGIYLRFYDANKNELDTSTRISKYVVAFGFTAPSTAVYTRIMWYKGGGLTPTNVVNALVQLEIGSTATSYAPYSNICPISGRTEARVDTENEDSTESAYAVIQLGTTVYGADINWDTGVMTVTHVATSITGDNVSTVSDQSATDTEGGKRININIINAKYCGSGTGLSDIISDRLSVTSADGIYNSTTPNCIAVNNVGGIVLRYAGAATVEAAKAALNANPVQACYALATPTTLQLTPTQLEMLKGYNRVSIEDGSIEIGYIAKLT